MTRRRLVALVSAAVLLTLGLLVFATGLFVTHTTTGRRKLHDFIQPMIASKIRGGSLYLGAMSGNFIGNLTFDSVAIRDKRGDLFLSTGRVTVSYNWRDIVDNRILVYRAEIEHPYVHLVQHGDGQWNFKQIFASGVNIPKLPKDLNTRNLGDYIVINGARARDFTFLLTMPWHPDDTLRAAARDSAIRAHLTNPAKAVARTFDGYGRTYAWRHGHALLAHARLADPDSDKTFGQEFRVDSLSVDEYEPTFKFRQVKATARHLGDSLWFEVPRFNMPASTGTARGKVVWGSDLPVRYDIAVRGDSVSLDDVNWVYPTLPRTGGGTLDLLIKNDPKNLKVLDFKLVKMDVRSTKSHVSGDMSFGVGAPVLLVRNVDLRADPMDFDLIRTLNGKPFPVDWQGQIVGTAKGRGGPLTHFVVDDARGTFADAHVPGAVSRFAGKGELDILQPAFTAFHGFYVDAQSIDLRSIEYLYPSFPRLGGVASGTATLDSSWLDVRFSNAHVAHQDGPGEPSRFSGSGRITYGEPFMIYDVALEAEPVSLTMLARSYPALPLRGLMSGPVRAKGSSPDLELTTSLQGANGAFSFDGRIDIDSLGGYGAHGRGQISALNVAGLLEKPSVPIGTVSGHYDVDVDAIMTPSIHGAANLELDRTVLDSMAVYASRASVRFANGRMLIDSLRLRTSAATLVASGGIGLPKGRADSLHFRIDLDSLGGLRRYIPHSDTTLLGEAAAAPDSLSGTASLSGVAFGTFDSLGVIGRLAASDLYINNSRVDSISARFDLRNALHAPSGAVALRMDTVKLAGVVLDTVGGLFSFDDATHARFSAGALSANGPTLATVGTWSSAAGAQNVVVDSLGLTVGDARWHLAAPARFTRDSISTRLDSLVLRNRDTASIALMANIPGSGSVFGQLRGSRVPLLDLSRLAQLHDSLTGVADIAASVNGTKSSPRIAMNAALSAIKWKDVAIDSVTSSTQYADARVKTSLIVVRDGQRALAADASLPYTVTLFSLKARNDSLSGSVSIDSTDLSLIQNLFRTDLKLSGRLAAKLGASGTLRQPVLAGNISVNNGSADVKPLGVVWNDINGNVSGTVTSAGQDSIHVNLRAATSGEIAGTQSLDGWVKNLFQAKARQPFSFAFGANSFHAFSKRSLADLYISTTDSLRLSGSVQAPTLTGGLYVPRGAIFLMDRDLARKQAVERITDTTAFGTVSSGVPAVVSTLMSNLQISNVTVTLGNDVYLRSAEANVKLAGELRLEPSTIQSTRTLASTGELVPRLSLFGTLRTVGGHYNLNLGLVQREFQVLSDGSVTFTGPYDNPTLDVRARYNVRQYHDRDLGIIVKLQGPLLPYPGISFTSTADYDIATSDLVSYLLTGKPGFDFGANPRTTEVLSSFLAPTVSAYTSEQLRQRFGSFFDVFQFQLGTTGNAQAGSGFLSTDNLSQYLYGSTIGAEKQFKNNLYLSVNTGLCQFDPHSNTSFNNLNLFGAKIEYRIRSDLSTQLAYDPPTLARTCSQSQNITGLVPTPGQFSLGLFHTWRF